jgi:hypothetical protein
VLDINNPSVLDVMKKLPDQVSSDINTAKECVA